MKLVVRMAAGAELDSPSHLIPSKALEAIYDLAESETSGKASITCPVSLGSVPSILPVETFDKEPIVSPVDEDLKTSAGEEKAAPTSPPSSNDSSPTYTTLKAVVEAPKVGENFMEAPVLTQDSRAASGPLWV